MAVSVGIEMMKDFGGDNDLVALEPAEGFTDDLFGQAVAVSIGGIKEVHADFNGVMERRHENVAGLFTPELWGSLPASVADGSYMKVR